MTFSSPPTRRSAGLARGLAAGTRLGARTTFSIALISVIAGLFLALLAAPAAQAADYRYWTFWTGTPQGTWTFATKGPADITVTNEFVEGWRFTISPASGGSPQPRIASQYAELCPNPDVKSGEVGVAVVIDYGVANEAPPGETPPAGPVTKCVSVPTGSSAATALAAAGVVRQEKGMVCGVDGYPAKECGVEVAALPATSESPIPGGLKPTKAPVDASGLPTDVSKTSDLSPWPFVLTAVGIFAVIILVSWFFLRIRKRNLEERMAARRATAAKAAGTSGTSDDSTPPTA